MTEIGMSIIEAIILGIIQGLSEFIPISSTAHLTIAGQLMGLIDPNNPEQWTAFIATIQIGTLAAVLAYFSSDLKAIPSAMFNDNIGKGRKPFREQSTQSRLGWYIIIGTIPIVIIGLILKKLIEGGITKEPIVIASSLIILAIILAIAEFFSNKSRSIDKITLFDSIIIGFAQSVALIPGASRSGTTLTAGLFLGLNRESAARFSFLLSIPAVLASGLLEFYQSLNYINTADLFAIISATIASAVSGYMAIAFLLNFLKKRSTMIFIIYRILLGILLLYMAFTNVL